MNVLLLSNMYPSTRHPGCGVFVRNQVRELARRHGVRFTEVVARGRSRSLPAKLAKYAKLHGRAWAAAALRHDLTHLHYPSFSHLAAALPALSIGRRPLVLTVHRGEIYSLPRRGLRRTAVAALLRRADAVIAVSGDLADRLTGDLGVAPSRVTCIDVGCDLSLFRPVLPAAKGGAKQALGLDAGRPALLFAGRLSERKGVDVLIRALAAADPQGRWTTLIAGSGPWRASLERLASAAAPRARIRWLGELSHDELPRWFAAADAFVLPSRSEGTPTVLLESMASGTPVLASRVGGIPELVTHDVNGWTFESEDHEGLARGLTALAADPGLAERLARRALADVAEHSLERQAGRIFEIYRTLAGRNA